MKTLTNIYKAVKLLSNPSVNSYLESQLNKSTPEEAEAKFGKGDAFYHKHYIVHIVG